MKAAKKKRKPGRPYGTCRKEPTKVMRIPESKIQEVTKIIKK